MNRRTFFSTTIGITAGASLIEAEAASATAPAAGKRTMMVASANGLKALEAGMAVLKKGEDTLDAALATVNIVEDDPADNSVGYGGLPNEDGEVELDASVMHGPTRRAGAVAALKHIKNPSLVARKVMERTDHVLLAGTGALRFAKAHGFQEQNLLTEESRVAWLAWKEGMSDRDAWGPGLASPEWKERVAELLPKGLTEGEQEIWLERIREVLLNRPTGTISCLAVSERGDISGTTTTSGLAWKIAGRVGDSPIIGAGLYVDNDVGAAGSTGRGEENIKVNGAHTIVEMMRQGKSPTEACLLAEERIVRNYAGDKKKLRTFTVHFYAVNKDGVHGGATLWQLRPGGRPRNYAIHDGSEAKLVPMEGLVKPE